MLVSHRILHPLGHCSLKNGDVDAAVRKLVASDNSHSHFPFSIPPNTTLAGQVGMIVCWCWDDDRDIVTYGVSLIPDLQMGTTKEFEPHEWSIFAAALGAYSPRTPELDKLHEIALRGFKGELPPGLTTHFCD